MNENINLLEILKGVPDGTKLWSPICGECEVESIIHCDEYPIKTIHGKGNGTQFYNFNFTSQGKRCNNSEAECVLFPSKENRDWSTFTAKRFKPFQKVLVADYFSTYGKYIWCADWYSHFDEKSNKHFAIGSGHFSDDKILPYEGNEDKIGKPVEIK